MEPFCGPYLNSVPLPTVASDGTETQPLTQELLPDTPPQGSPAVLEAPPSNPVHSYGIHPTSYTEPPAIPSNLDLFGIELVYVPSCPDCVKVGGGYCSTCAIVIK